MRVIHDHTVHALARSPPSSCWQFLRRQRGLSPGLRPGPGPSRACDLDGGQRQRDVLEPVVLRRVLRLRPHPRRQGFLPDRHDHAQHAGPADPALARSGELAVPRLRARYARSRPGVPPRRGQARLRAGHLGAELPLPQGHVPHLQQRQRPDDAAVPCHQPRRAVDAHRDEAIVPRSVGALRRRREGLRRVGLPRHPPRRADPRSARHRARHGARDHRRRARAWARASTSTRSAGSTS